MLIVVPIGERPLEELLTASEDATFDRKAAAFLDEGGAKSDKQLLDVMATVASFLNTGGGTVLIGVDDRGQVVGIEKDARAFREPDQEHWGNELRRQLKKHLGPEAAALVRIEFLPYDGPTIARLRCEISESPVPLRHPPEKKNAVYIRQEAASIPVTPSEAFVHGARRARERRVPHADPATAEAVDSSPSSARELASRHRAAADEARRLIGRPLEHLANRTLGRHHSELVTVLVNELAAGELHRLGDAERLLERLVEKYQLDDARRLLEDAEKALPGEIAGDPRDWLAYWRIRIAARASSPEHQLDALADLLATAPPDRDLTLNADLLLWLGTAKSYAGAPEESAQLLERALTELAEIPQGRDTRLRERQVWRTMLGNAEAHGRYTTFSARLSELRRRGAPDPDIEPEWARWLAIAQGSMSQHQRRPRQALSFFDQAVEFGRSAVPTERLSLDNSLAHCQIEIGTGQALEAAEFLLEMMTARRGDPELDPQVFAYVDRHRGHLAAVRGELTEAAAAYDRSTSAYARRNATRGTWRSWVLRARAFRRIADVDRAAETRLAWRDEQGVERGMDMRGLRDSVRLHHWTALWTAVLGGCALAKGDRAAALDHYVTAFDTALQMSRFVVDEVAGEIAAHVDEANPASRSRAQADLRTWWMEHGVARETALRAAEVTPEDPVDPTVIERFEAPESGRLHVAVAPRW